MTTTLQLVRSPRRPVFVGNRQARGTEKWGLVANYLHRWHYSDGNTLLQVMGLAHRSSKFTLTRWVKKGWLQVAHADQYPVSPLYLLTVAGLQNVPDLSEAKYNTRRGSVKVREVHHDLTVQRVALSLESKYDEVIPTRLIRSFYMEQFHDALDEPTRPYLKCKAGIDKLCEDPHWHIAQLKYRQDWLHEKLTKDELRMLKECEVSEEDVHKLSERYHVLGLYEEKVEKVKATEKQYANALVPDLILLKDDTAIALEIERSRKDVDRFKHALQRHRDNLETGLYDLVEYWCRGFAERLSNRADKADLEDYRDRFTFMNSSVFGS